MARDALLQAYDPIAFNFVRSVYFRTRR